MKKIAIFLLSLSLFSCSKISQSSLQGTWSVNSILLQEITSHNDTGWKDSQSAASIFFIGESLTISKSTIIPCNTAASYIRQFDDYPGCFNYSLSGATISIPEVHYTKVEKNGDTIVRVDEYTQYAMDFNVDINGGEMMLSSSSEITDNLGNVERRVKTKISLSKVQ